MRIWMNITWLIRFPECFRDLLWINNYLKVGNKGTNRQIDFQYEDRSVVNSAGI